jgi:hypothetical protein
MTKKSNKPPPKSSDPIDPINNSNQKNTKNTNNVNNKKKNNIGNVQKRNKSIPLNKKIAYFAMARIFNSPKTLGITNSSSRRR